MLQHTPSESKTVRRRCYTVTQGLPHRHGSRHLGQFFLRRGAQACSVLYFRHFFQTTFLRPKGTTLFSDQGRASFFHLRGDIDTPGLLYLGGLQSGRAAKRALFLFIREIQATRRRRSEIGSARAVRLARAPMPLQPAARCYFRCVQRAIARYSL